MAPEPEPDAVDPYLAQHVRDAIACEVAELGIEVERRGDRLVLQGHLDHDVCDTVLAAARRAAAPVPVIDELEHLGTRPVAPHAERIEP